MFKKHTVLLGIVTAVALLVLATLLYPGGSLADNHSVGFDWTKNFISNLFNEKAMNGTANPGRFFAVGGMFFLALSFGLFFNSFAEKVPSSHATKMIRFLGLGGMVFTFLIATPLHDSMIPIASTLFLISLFYITVFLFKSRLHFYSLLCVGFLMLFYFTLYLYGAGQLVLLPIVQKITFGSALLVVLCLHYGIQKEHLHPKK